MKCFNNYIKAINKNINVPEDLLTCLFDKNKNVSDILNLIYSLSKSNKYDNFILSKLNL